MTRGNSSEPASLEPADQPDDANAEDNLEFVLRRAARYVTLHYERSLDPVGLTAPQFTILRRLTGRAPMTMVELARIVMIERTTMVRALQVLEKDGLVISQATSPRSRVLRLSVSERGKQRLVQASAIWRTAQREFEARFGVNRAAHLRSELFGMTGRQFDNRTGPVVEPVSELESESEPE